MTETLAIFRRAYRSGELNPFPGKGLDCTGKKRQLAASAERVERRRILKCPKVELKGR
jgi:hypothetical protein